MHSPQSTTFSIENLAFERNNQVLFDRIDCALSAGDLLQIRGANGCGKSTLLRLLAGFIEVQQGVIRWQGNSICQQRETYQQQLHYLGHQNGIKPNLTAYENLHLQLALTTHKPNQKQIHAALESVELQHVMHNQTLHFSAGQARRLSLARLLLQPAPLWILDEPTTALDHNGQALLIDLIDQHAKNGGITVLATHQVLPFTSNVQSIQLGEQHA